MNYIKENIKQGITLHKIKTNKFKTNLFSVFITTKLNREDVTKNALLTSVLRRGTKNLNSQELISQNLENMYGASFDCGVDKVGDNHVLKFYLESINNDFLPTNENLSKQCFSILLDIVFNPYVENNGFKEEYVKGEKETIKQIIEGKIDNKAKYAFERCIEEMYKDEPYGLYKYGYIDDLKNIAAQDLYEYYINLIKNAKIDIFVSGNLEDDIINEIKENEIINNLNERTAIFNITKKDLDKKKLSSEKIINESMQITQGKLIIGMDVLNNKKEDKYAISVYNVILGGSANSKMFQNVREKASLAYTVGSNYLKQKGNIFIKCGIDISNYEKALELIRVQLDEMKQGKFEETDMENAKLLISSTVGSIPESQDSEIMYYYVEELSEEFVSIEDYIKNIEKVSKDEIINIANNMQINTIYFLKD
ncbi:MAG: insulinase family protein [Clostridiales bacterium]|nr:insulinase family protein [Clostridiales bacterium]